MRIYNCPVGLRITAANQPLHVSLKRRWQRLLNYASSLHQAFKRCLIYCCYQLQVAPTLYFIPTSGVLSISSDVLHNI